MSTICRHLSTYRMIVVLGRGVGACVRFAQRCQSQAIGAPMGCRQGCVSMGRLRKAWGLESIVVVQYRVLVVPVETNKAFRHSPWVPGRTCMKNKDKAARLATQ